MQELEFAPTIILATALHLEYNVSTMIIPEVKRVVRFDKFPGKTIKEVTMRGFYLRFIFTDGTFADLDTEDDKIVLDKGKVRKQRPYH
jgi:hypothetical protein